MVVWAEKDSNLRSRKTADLQSAPVGRLGICPPWYCFFIKKPDITRTLRKEPLAGIEPATY